MSAVNSLEKIEDNVVNDSEEPYMYICSKLDNDYSKNDISEQDLIKYIVNNSSYTSNEVLKFLKLEKTYLISKKVKLQ